MKKSNRYLYINIGTLVAVALPIVALAADIGNLNDLRNQLIGLINSIIPLLFGLALLAFMWSVIKYIWSGDVAKLKEARRYMVFSIIAIAVMMSVWGLAYFVKNSFFPSASTPLHQSVDPKTYQNVGDKTNPNYCEKDSDCPNTNGVRGTCYGHYCVTS
jgi:hypothetical protein